jgi:putative membrane protein insertion efficiency factor
MCNMAHHTAIPHDNARLDNENPSSPSTGARVVRLAFTLPIKFYQIVFAGAPRVCRFEPTCSQYAIEAIEKHGIFKGTAMALWRILRCNPWSTGGYDPVR